MQYILDNLISKLSNKHYYFLKSVEFIASLSIGYSSIIFVTKAGDKSDKSEVTP